MDLARLRSRRSVLALAIVGAFSRVVPAQAQWTNGCEYGIVNGLLSIGGDQCELPVPGHMIDDTPDAAAAFDGNVGSSTLSPRERRIDNMQDRRYRRRTQRGRKTQRQQDKQDRQYAQKILCSDFSTQKEAVEALVQSPGEAWRLDPDEDGIPCQELTPLSCKTFSSQADATSWWTRMGYTTKFDPFGLFDYEVGAVCPKRGVCDDFSTQKAAVEWITDHPKDRERLDPQNDGSACAKLTPVTCKSFSTQSEATTWFNHNGFVKTTRDPYQLYDAETKSICPTKVTCANFTTQKAAIEWATDHPDDRDRLDPNHDGLACTNLTKVICSQFASSTEVKKWHENNSLTNDPYGLYDTAAGRYCSSLPVVANG